MMTPRNCLPLLCRTLSSQYKLSLTKYSCKRRLAYCNLPRAGFPNRDSGDFLFSYARPEHHHKSEPVPQTNTGPVKIAVADNFDQVVTNSGRDALIQFYKPSCQYCEELEPIWDELGEAMKNEDIDIVKMNAIANDCPFPFSVNRYPTIYMKFATGTQNPIKYSSGERSLQSFIRFLSKHASKELIGWDRMGKPRKLKNK